MLSSPDNILIVPVIERSFRHLKVGAVEAIRQAYKERLANVEKLVRFANVQNLFNFAQEQNLCKTRDF